MKVILIVIALATLFVVILSIRNSIEGFVNKTDNVEEFYQAPVSSNSLIGSVVSKIKRVFQGFLPYREHFSISDTATNFRQVVGSKFKNINVSSDGLHVVGCKSNHAPYYYPINSKIVLERKGDITIPNKFKQITGGELSMCDIDSNKRIWGLDVSGTVKTSILNQTGDDWKVSLENGNNGIVKMRYIQVSDNGRHLICVGKENDDTTTPIKGGKVYYQSAVMPESGNVAPIVANKSLIVASITDNGAVWGVDNLGNVWYTKNITIAPPSWSTISTPGGSGTNTNRLTHINVSSDGKYVVACNGKGEIFYLKTDNTNFLTTAIWTPLTSLSDIKNASVTNNGKVWSIDSGGNVFTNVDVDDPPKTCAGYVLPNAKWRLKTDPSLITCAKDPCEMSECAEQKFCELTQCQGDGSPTGTAGFLKSGNTGCGSSSNPCNFETCCTENAPGASILSGKLSNINSIATTQNVPPATKKDTTSDTFVDSGKFASAADILDIKNLLSSLGIKDSKQTKQKPCSLDPSKFTRKSGIKPPKRREDDQDYVLKSSLKACPVTNDQVKQYNLRNQVRSKILQDVIDTPFKINLNQDYASVIPDEHKDTEKNTEKDMPKCKIQDPTYMAQYFFDEN